MKRFINCFAFVIIFTCNLLVFHGCAMNKSFSMKDSNISNLNVAYYESPKFKWNTVGGLPILVLSGIVGAELFHSLSPDNKIYPTDYGQFIMLKYVERAKKEFPNWPSMVVVDKPIVEDNEVSNPVLEFKVNRLLYAFLVGFVSDTVVTMKDRDGNVIWQKSFVYKSSYYNRKKSLEDYEANNYKLLIEEMEFAANMTVNDFIEHLKKGAS